MEALSVELYGLSRLCFDEDFSSLCAGAIERSSQHLWRLYLLFGTDIDTLILSLVLFTLRPRFTLRNVAERASQHRFEIALRAFRKW